VRTTRSAVQAPLALKNEPKRALQVASSTHRCSKPVHATDAGGGALDLVYWVMVAAPLATITHEIAVGRCGRPTQSVAGAVRGQAECFRCRGARAG
jgi:hypothetical protein